jgi:hypothetical protein
MFKRPCFVYIRPNCARNRLRYTNLGQRLVSKSAATADQDRSRAHFEPRQCAKFCSGCGRLGSSSSPTAGTLGLECHHFLIIPTHVAKQTQRLLNTQEQKVFRIIRHRRNQLVVRCRKATVRQDHLEPLSRSTGDYISKASYRRGCALIHERN